MEKERRDFIYKIIEKSPVLIEAQKKYFLKNINVFSWNFLEDILKIISKNEKSLLSKINKIKNKNMWWNPEQWKEEISTNKQQLSEQKKN